MLFPEPTGPVIPIVSSGVGLFCGAAWWISWQRARSCEGASCHVRRVGSDVGCRSGIAEIIGWALGWQRCYHLLAGKIGLHVVLAENGLCGWDGLDWIGWGLW